MSWKTFLGLAPNSSATEGEHHLTSRSGEFLSALVFLGVAVSFLAVLGKCGCRICIFPQDKPQTPC